MRKGFGLLFWSLLCLTVGLIVEGDATTISYVTPHSGGINGGTQIKIIGSDFDTKLDLTSSEPSMTVFLASDFRSYPCDIHESENDENNVVCYTRQMDAGAYYIRMTIDGESLDDANYCQGRPKTYNCRFYVEEWRTPNIYSLSWQTGEPQQLVTVTGRIHTNIISSSEAEATNGVTAAITRVYSAGESCNLYNETSEPYSIFLHGEDGESRWGEFQCFLEGSFIGYRNLSFLVNEAYGRSLPYAQTKKISVTNDIYMLQTYAVVTDISPKEGSTLGGTLLTISGRHFYNATDAITKVRVGGEECDVMSVTDTEIKCKTPEEPATSQSMYSGGRGMIVEVFPGETDISASLDSSSAGTWNFFVDHTHPNNEFGVADTFVSRSRGYFIPSVTAKHMFYIKADDQIQFSFNKDGSSSSGADSVTLSEGAGRQKNSESYDLQAGMEYYFEVRHLESSSSQYFQIGVYIEKADYTSDQTSVSVTEVQTIGITSTVAKEVQEISFVNWVEQTEVESRYTVAFECTPAGSDCSGQPFRFGLFGSQTDQLLYNVAAASSVADAINSLVGLASDSVEVGDAGNGSFEITFKSTRGRMILTASTLDGSPLSVVVTEDIQGKPKLDTFTFKIDEYVSPPMPVNASEEEVSDAVKSLFGPSCPQGLGAVAPGVVFYDMETNSVTPSGSRSTEKSFCGIYSLKNPTDFYRDTEDNPYRVGIYKYVCFGYSGDISNYLTVYYTYKQSNDEGESETIAMQRAISFSDMVDSIDTWTYVCHNLEQSLYQEHTEGFDFKISRVRISAGSDGDTDLFVDNIYIGPRSDQPEERAELLNRVVPSAVPHIKLERVEVLKTDSKYTITFHPLDCGNNFPLLGFAFSESMTTSGNQVQHNFGDGTSQIHVDRTSSASPPVTGTFSISFNDSNYRSLTGLSASIEAEDLQNELETLKQIDIVDATRSETCYGYTWTVSFTSPAGNYPAMSADGSGLMASPDAATVTTTTNANGGLYMNPIYGDFLRTAHETTQVQVFIDGILSHCEGASDSDTLTNCNFEWTTSATPTLTTVTPSSGPSGTAITIAGTGFSTTASDNMVKVGSAECAVTTSSSNSITCTLGDSVAGHQSLSVEVNGKGLASGAASFEVTGSITSINPTSGSEGGCTTVTISGFGFDSSSTVTIGGNDCSVIGATTYDSISCVTSAGSGAGTAVVVTTAGVDVMSSVQYSYTSPTASVSSVSAAQVLIGDLLTISGSGFGSTSGVLYIGGVKANVDSWTDTEIMVLVPALSSGSYNVGVQLPNNAGCASSSQTVTFSFTVTGISPQEGSLVGGTEVTLTGSGFNSDMLVKFGDVDCEVTSVSGDGTSSTCTTTSSGSHHLVRNTGRHPTIGLGYAWEPSTLDVIAGDMVTIGWSHPIFVEGFDITLQTSADASSNEYDGEGFQVAPASSGQHTYTLNNAGTIYYNSGCLTDDCSLIMRGTINVADASDNTQELSVSRMGVDATYPSGAPSFTFRSDKTAVATSISPNQGTTSTEISIAGSGFGSSPQVQIGDKMCAVQSANDTSITCTVSSDEELSIGIYHEVVVKTSDGSARNEIARILDRKFVLLPEVESISPTSGSLQGGTLVTIEGSGFSMLPSSVNIGGWAQCNVNPDSVSYTSFVCVTSGVTSDKSGDAQVTIGSSTAACKNPCEFSYASASTPQVTTFSHDSAWGNLEMTFGGSGFGTTMADITVTLASGDLSTQCVVSSVIDTTVVCTAPRFAVGVNTVSVHVKGKGLAHFDSAVDRDVDNPATVDGVSPASGSINGGTTLTVTGNGFVDGSTTVIVGGLPCAIKATDLSSVTCVTSAVSAGSVNVEVNSNGQTYTTVQFEYSSSSTPQVDSVSPAQALSSETITLSGSGFGTDASAVAVTAGGVDCSVTSVSDTEIQCTLGLREGGAAAIEVNVAGYGLASIDAAATFNYVLNANSVAPTSGSYGGSQSLTVDGNGFSENTVVTICGNECIVQSQTTLEITCLTPANSDLSSGTTACDVAVANGDNLVTLTNGYSYQSSLTPAISSVSPNRGGTGGGTRITITGTGFSASASSVTIDGVVCDVQSSTTTEIVCDTNAHQGSIQTKVAVSAGTNGIAVQENADFHYIDRWGSVFTWGGTTVPQDGEFVVIQKGQTVLLDTDTAILKMLLIDGGEVIFDEVDVQLNAENILITNGGLLQVGTEDEPFQHKATIEMHGHLRSPELPIYGAKTLGVRNGSLELHGRHITHTWCLLAATAEAGATEITLQHSVSDWQVNDEIVIASTGLRHSQSENEQRTISAVSADGLMLTLDEPLEYRHLGVTETIAGRNIEYRAEVGLLTRNVVFRGSNSDAWHDDIPKCEAGFETGQFATQTCFQGRHGAEVGSDQFGGSIMMHSKYPSSPDIMARIENVEVTYAGQAFRLGRYPIHWHLMGNVSGMYVRKCAIHKTFNRAVTIHGTHNLLVEGNVVYDIMGGAIFIEDGIETKNVIQYNLAVFVRQSTSLLNDDITPAAYWVTNPDNILRHNHAAGGTHFGFWYRMHEHPDGPSFDPNICQQNVELGEFYNNTVHSQGWFGLWIFQSYFPMEGGGCGSTVPSPAKFRSLTTWNCEKGAEWVNCGAIQFIDFVLVDNEVAALDLKLIKGTAWGEERGALIKDTLIAGHSSLVPSGYESDRGIILPFAPGLTVSSTHFANFDRHGAALSITSIQGTCTIDCGGFYNHFENIEFTNVNKKVSFRWPHEAALLDKDGSITGTAGSTIVPFTRIMDPTLCAVQAGNEYSEGTEAAICQPSVTFHRMAVNQPFPSSLEGNDLYMENEHGNSSSTYQKKRLTHKSGWMFMLPSQNAYKMFWEFGEQFTNLTYNARFYDFKAGDKIFLTHILTQDPDYVQINSQEPFPVANATELDSSSRNLDWYYNTFANNLTIQLSNDDDASARKRRSIEIVDDEYKHVTVSPTIYRCFYENCLGPVDADDIPPSEDKPEGFTLWSDESNPCIEGMGTDSIVIKKSTDDIELCWVVVDVDNITVKNLTILGVLHFEDHDCTVEATYIMVLGRLFTRSTGIGYYNKQLSINLVGDHNTPAWSLPGIELGSKAIGCFGGCELHGIPHEVYWTHLEETVQPGSKTIKLQQPVIDWNVGDEIVITTTGYRSMETEKHTIEAIDAEFRTITLEKTLAYRHMGETYNIGGVDYEMRAEVGLLTRNVKIQGVRYSNMDSQAFGARVLVGYTTSAGSVEEVGWARFSDVEFFQTGQEGWTEPWDPRFSLAFVNTGTPSPARPSSVHGCAFHDGFSTAIGTFGANKITFSKNVVHRTIHDGIRITGSGHSLIGNLVTVTLFRGTWGERFELTNFKDWQASFEISEATNLIMTGNTAAGSERVGFHTDGQPCDTLDDAAWSGNTAHGCLHGIQMLQPDGVGSCSLLTNFFIYKSWDFGIYHQVAVSIVVRNTAIFDAKVGYLPFIFGPAALSHTFEDKTASVQNLTCVGRSNDFNSALDFMDERNDKNLLVRAAGPDRTAPFNNFGGKTCIMLPMFQSSRNGAPFKAFHNNMNYPSIRGLLNITGLRAHNFNMHGDGTRDLIFTTNPLNEDIYHPTVVSNFVQENVDSQCKVFFARPSLGKVNPSDCVDMECDGMKKVMIKDLDGSFLGEVGAIIPQAEFAWDDPNHLNRGLGDYRIPKSLLSDTSGNRVPVTNIIDHRGIVRSDTCTYNNAWQAYDCHGTGTLDYQMLVIESLDEDTETRRLSPVALLSDRYIDLNNGPQDHGWCFGYTCQKRISTFYTIVASEQHFEIHFTGYAPRNLSLQLLNVDDSVTVRVALWYARPERLDVYRGDNNAFIHPQNAVYKPDADHWALTPITADNIEEYKPAINSPIHGANFMDFETRLLYVTLRGSTPVRIVTVPAVIVTFGFPAVSIDDFFGENLIFNLANFLGVSEDKVRIVNIVRETSRRRRQATSTSTETVMYSIMYSDELTNSSYSPADEDTAIEVLNNGVEALIIAYQNNTLSVILGINATTFAAAPISVNVDDEVSDNYLVTYNIPRSISVTSLPSSTEENLEFSQQPLVTLMDEDGNRVATLDNIFEVSVTLDTSGSNADPTAQLRGTTSMMFTNGSAQFSDLMITHLGTYSLRFEITQPAGVSLETTSTSVIVTQRSVQAVFVGGVSQLLEHDSSIDVTVELQNSAGLTLPDVGYKGHSWKVDVSLDASIYGSTSLGGVTSFNFNTATGQATTTGLKLVNTVSNFRYNLMFTIYTEPALYSMQIHADPIKFVAPGEVTTLPTQKNLAFMLSGIPYLTRNDASSKATFDTFLHNEMAQTAGTKAAQITTFSSSTSSDGDTAVNVLLSAPNEVSATTAIAELTRLFESGLSYNGNDLTLSSSSNTCGLSVDGVCLDDSATVAVIPSSSPESSSQIWIYIVVGVVLAVVLAAGAIIMSCFLKRANNNKVGASHGITRCLDAESSRGSTPFADSFYTGSTDLQPPPTDSQMGNYHDLRHRSGMTPVET